jgi:organic radical activating enzyme
VKAYDFSELKLSKFIFHGVMENELLVIGLPGDFSAKEVEEFSNKGQEFTKKLHFSVKNVEDVKKFFAFKKRQFTVGVPLAFQKKKSAEKFFHSIDEKIIESFSSLAKEAGDIQLIPEFAMDGDLIQLGPTLCKLIEIHQVKRAYLNVVGFPDDEKVQQIRSLFEHLRLKGIHDLQVYPTFLNKYYKEWNAKTFNTFAGLRRVDIDLSNKCTHSCVFCGLWSNEAIAQIKKVGGGKIDKNYQEFMNKQIPFESVLQLLKSLPDTVEQIDYGGAGDPLTHPRWLEILEETWKRGFNVVVYSNFEYPSTEQLDYLLKLAEKSSAGLRIILNISASNPQMYTQVRPRQSAKVFEKVISNIKFVQKYKRTNFEIILLFIMNSVNFKEAKEMVRFAADLGWPLWFKPIEVHGEVHRKYIIQKEQMKEYVGLLVEALKEANNLGIHVYDQATIKELAAQYL